MADSDIHIDAEGWAVVALPEVVDIHTAEGLRGDLLSLIDSGHPRHRLDCAAVAQIDSTGLAVIMAYMASLHRECADTVVLFDGLSVLLKRLLSMFRVQDFEVATEFRERA